MAHPPVIHVPDEHIRLMYEDGLTQREIADAIGVHQTTVGVRLRRMGISRRHRWESATHGRRKRRA